MQPFWLHPASEYPIEITCSIPGVVGAVQPDSDFPTRLKELWELLERQPAIRRVVEYAQTVDYVKALWSKWKREHIGLQDEGFAACQVLRCRFNGAAQIDAYDVRSPFRYYIGVTAHAATDIEHQLPAQIIGSKAGLFYEVGFGSPASLRVQLRVLMLQPLISETSSVLLGVDKAEQTSDNWNTM